MKETKLPWNIRANMQQWLLSFLSFPKSGRRWEKYHHPGTCVLVHHNYKMKTWTGTLMIKTNNFSDKLKTGNDKP